MIDIYVYPTRKDIFEKNSEKFKSIISQYGLSFLYIRYRLIDLDRYRLMYVIERNQL